MKMNLFGWKQPLKDYAENVLLVSVNGSKANGESPGMLVEIAPSTQASYPCYGSGTGSLPGLSFFIPGTTS